MLCFYGDVRTSNFLCGHDTLTEGVFVTQLSINAEISVSRTVWVTTNCRFMSEMFVCSSGGTAPFPSIACFLAGQIRKYTGKSPSGFSLRKVVVWFGDHEVNFGKPREGQNDCWRAESVWNERVLRAKPSQFCLRKK